MQLIHTILALRKTLNEARERHETIGYVPTMGNLHAGHCSLVDIAKQHADRVVVSVFVNPTQFGPTEDLAKYPRTLNADCHQLEALGVDWVFAPSVEEMYPKPLSEITQVTVPEVSDILCGAHRPGHFRGVATVVNILFNLVGPCLAVFGEKDFQQLFIIKRLVADLKLPVQIMPGFTIREADGLAMSSRNQYLNGEERQAAPLLYHTLMTLTHMVQQGRRDYAALCEEGRKVLEAARFQVDYLSVCDASTLQPANQDTQSVVILAAAFLGKTRLIDNCVVALGKL